MQHDQCDLYLPYSSFRDSFMLYKSAIFFNLPYCFNKITNSLKVLKY